MLGDEFFSDQPLWTLDESDPRQSMARLTLRSVAVRNGTLIVTLGDDDEPVDPDSVTPHTPHNLAPDGSRRSDRSDSNNRRGSHGSSRGNGNSSGNDTDGGDDSRGSDGRDDSDGNESTPAPGNGTEEGGGSSVWL